MLTAEALYIQSDIRPTDFGTNVVPKNVTDPAAQRALAITHIEDNILPDAVSEVSVPFVKASGGADLPLENEYILRRYPNAAQPVIDSLNSNLQRLYDAAVKSYARAEINDQINSNNDSYDKDSNKYRTTANEQLQKLLMALEDIEGGTPEDTTGPINRGVPSHTSAPTVFVF